MIAFEVKDMSCGHCVSAITQAVQAVAPEAQVQIDLGQQRVQITATNADAQTLSDAIAEAGYTPTRLAAAGPAPAGSGGRRCCAR